MRLFDFRKCPVCGHQYSIKKYLREFLRSNSDSVWQCEKCKTLMTYKRYKLTFVLSILPLVFTSSLSGLFSNKFLGYTIVISISIAWFLAIFLLTTFKKIKIDK